MNKFHWYKHIKNRPIFKGSKDVKRYMLEAFKSAVILKLHNRN